MNKVVDEPVVVIRQANNDQLKQRFAGTLMEKLEKYGGFYFSRGFISATEEMNERMRVIGIYARHLFELFKNNTLLLTHEDSPSDMLDEVKLRALMPKVIEDVKLHYQKFCPNCISKSLWTDYIDAFEKRGYIIHEAQ